MSFKTARGERRATGPKDPDSDRTGLRARVRRAMEKAQDTFYGLAGSGHAWLAQAGANRRDPAENKRRRRLIGEVLGVVAIGATAYFAQKGLSPHHPLDANTLMPHGGSGSAGHSFNAAHAAASSNPLNVEALPAKPAGVSDVHHAVHEHVGHIASHHTMVTLHEGQNPWTVSEHELKAEGIAHPNNLQIQTYDTQMAHANPGTFDYGGTSSEHLSRGTRLRLPKFNLGFYMRLG